MSATQEQTNRANMLAKRVKWFEDNLYDIRRDELAKDLSKFKIVLELRETNYKITPEMIDQLETMIKFLEDKYKPEDSYLWD